MGQKTAIEWTDATWNPIVGCTYASPGCLHCYARTIHDRRFLAWKRGNFPTAPEQYHKPFKQIQLMNDRLDEPFHWRKPRRVFVNSVSDLFHEDVPFEYIAKIWHRMYLAHEHTFQILTKRPERLVEFYEAYGHNWKALNTWSFVAPNIWLGTSVENQDYADTRIPYLLQVPASVHFLSCEPLLGPLEVSRYLGSTLTDLVEWTDKQYQNVPWPILDGVDWVITGGESGHHHRPMDLDWARSLRDQCHKSSVPFFFKQVGGRTPKAGGDLLDGVQWHQFPEAT